MWISSLWTIGASWSPYPNTKMYIGTSCKLDFRPSGFNNLGWGTVVIRPVTEYFGLLNLKFTAAWETNLWAKFSSVHSLWLSCHFWRNVDKDPYSGHIPCQEESMSIRHIYYIFNGILSLILDHICVGSVVADKKICLYLLEEIFCDRFPYSLTRKIRMKMQAFRVHIPIRVSGHHKS